MPSCCTDIRVGLARRRHCRGSIDSNRGPEDYSGPPYRDRNSLPDCYRSKSYISPGTEQNHDRTRQSADRFQLEGETFCGSLSLVHAIDQSVAEANAAYSLAAISVKILQMARLLCLRAETAQERIIPMIRDIMTAKRSAERKIMRQKLDTVAFLLGRMHTELSRAMESTKLPWVSATLSSHLSLSTDLKRASSPRQRQ